MCRCFSLYCVSVPLCDAMCRCLPLYCVSVPLCVAMCHCLSLCCVTVSLYIAVCHCTCRPASVCVAVSVCCCVVSLCHSVSLCSVAVCHGMSLGVTTCVTTCGMRHYVWLCCVADMQELKSCYHRFRRHFNHCAKKQRKHKEQLEWSPPAVVSPHSWCK